MEHRQIFFELQKKIGRNPKCRCDLKKKQFLRPQCKIAVKKRSVDFREVFFDQKKFEKTPDENWD